MDQPIGVAEGLLTRLERLCELATGRPSAELATARSDLAALRQQLVASDARLPADRDRAEAAAGRAEAQLGRLRKLIEHGPDGYLVTDTAGVITEANDAAAELLGVSLPYIIRKPLSLFIDERDLRAF